MRCMIGLLVSLALVGCVQRAPSEARPSRPVVSIRLSLTENSGQVVVVNGGTESYLMCRDALSLSSSGKTKRIPPFPKPLPALRPVELRGGASLTWQLIVKGNRLYPFTVDRGGLLLLDRQHRVRAIYHCTRPPAGGQSVPMFSDRIESNEVIVKVE